MITVTVQKKQEIGMVGALGAPVGKIVWVFLAQGMTVGLVGVAGYQHEGTARRLVHALKYRAVTAAAGPGRQ